MTENENPPLYRQLGPGLITGVSDDDPSGIATYSQAGSTFGYNLLWTMLFSYPLMVAIQTMCAHIGRVTGHGIAYNLQKLFGKKVLYPLVIGLLFANVINIGADILAMAEALKLLIGGYAILYCVGFGAISVLLQIYVPYRRYVDGLKWLSLSLLAYVATAFAVHIDWPNALRSTFLPHFSFDKSSFQMLVAIFGTTISPYLFFWQASQEVEDTRSNRGEKPLLLAIDQASKQFARIRVDTIIGMAVSNLVAFFIILTTAATLNTQKGVVIETAAQAAAALRPLAGELSYLLFSLGIIGTGLMAIPVLAGSTAYAVSETFHWPMGLAKKPHQAKYFYGVISAATFMGLLLAFIDINPIKALLWAAVVNGVISVPIAAAVVLMATKEKIMGPFAASTLMRSLGWVTVAVLFIVMLGLFFT